MSDQSSPQRRAKAKGKSKSKAMDAVLSGAGQSCSAGAEAGTPAVPAPPVAEKRPEVRTFSGFEIADDYAWLENPDDPDVIAYLEAENAYREAVMAPTADLQEQVYQEMLGRIQQTDVTVPTPWDDWFYYTRTVEGLQYPIIARRHGSLAADEEVLLDLNAMLRTGYISLREWSPSPDHRFLAYLLNETGGLEATLHVKDLTTGETLPDAIDLVAGVEWANDNRTLFYLKQDDARRSHQLRKHRLGDDPVDDEVVYTEEDEVFSLHLDKAKDQRVLFLTSASAETSEVRYRNADKPDGAWGLFAERRPGILYGLEHLGNDFLVHTNEDAQNFKVEKVSVRDPQGERQTVIPHDPIRLVSGIEVFERYLVVHGRSDANSRIWVMPHGGEMALLPFDEPAFVVRPEWNPTFASDTFRFVYASPVTPKSVWEVNVETGERTLLKQDVVPSGHDPSQYVLERRWAKAGDGERIPVTLLRRADAKGPQPTLLYGYGSYGINAEPYFRIDALSLVDRGATYAIAHIRGGQERGRFWYEEGKLLNKKNTFTDFIDVADHLIAKGITDKERLAIYGGSAGGLLMGAVVNMRPDLPRAVIAAVPFVDVMRVMLDPSLPLTTGEFVEWGNPADPEYHDYIASYSPYDNTVHRRYPSMLITGGVSDDQVPYWQPAKWIAKLRTMHHGDRPLLLRMEMGAGHAGASGRYDRLRETAGDWAFVLRELGLADVAPASVEGLNPEVAPPSTVRPGGLVTALPGFGGAPAATDVAAAPATEVPGGMYESDEVPYTPPTTIAWGHEMDGTVDPRAKTVEEIKSRVNDLLNAAGAASAAPDATAGIAADPDAAEDAPAPYLPPNTIAWGHNIDGTVDPRAKTLDDIKSRVSDLLHPKKDDE